MKLEEQALVIKYEQAYLMMERRMKGNFHVRCGVGENLEITSKDYLSL